jgi:hypothetical protein
MYEKLVAAQLNAREYEADLAAGIDYGLAEKEQQLAAEKRAPKEQQRAAERTAKEVERAAKEVARAEVERLMKQLADKA